MAGVLNEINILDRYLYINLDLIYEHVDAVTSSQHR